MWGALATWANYDLGDVPNVWAFFDYENTWRANPPDPADFAAQCALTPPDRDRRWDLIFGRKASINLTSAEMGTNGGFMPFVNGPSSKNVIGPAVPHL